jgi:glutamate carboxypeptidase
LVDQASHTAAREDVEEAARLVEERLTALGMWSDRFPDSEGRFADHRVFRTPATGRDDVAIALVGHVDTVFPRELGFLEFRREDGNGDVVRGPGVLDMKSGISAIVFALEALWETDRARFERLQLRFICNSDEEVGSPSSRSLLEELATKTSAALVFEGGRDEDRVITARKGGGMFTISAHGRAAHAGLAHAQGINAIHALALVIPRVEALTDHARGVTLNVGLIEGGTAKNTVPDLARCVIDGRFITRADAEAVAAALQEIVADPFAGLAGVPEHFEQVRFELGGGVTRPPMEATEYSGALREIYERSAEACGLRIGEAPLQGGGSDANILAACGVPCIDGLGPFGKHFHKIEEWSSLESLRRRTQALGMFLVDGIPQVEERIKTDHVRR